MQTSELLRRSHSCCVQARLWAQVQRPFFLQLQLQLNACPLLRTDTRAEIALVRSPFRLRGAWVEASAPLRAAQAAQIPWSSAPGARLERPYSMVNASLAFKEEVLRDLAPRMIAFRLSRLLYVSLSFGIVPPKPSTINVLIFSIISSVCSLSERSVCVRVSGSVGQEGVCEGVSRTAESLHMEMSVSGFLVVGARKTQLQLHALQGP